MTQPSALAPGDLVFEHLYGVGTVVQAEAARQRVRIAFGSGARRSERELTFSECKHVLIPQPTLPRLVFALWAPPPSPC